MKNEMRGFRRSQTGISLLEVLVVIVLTGLISTMLLQGITFSLAAFEKNRDFQKRYQRETLALGWFRGSVENMMASHDEVFSFRGTESSLMGYSLSPIFLSSGEIVRARWFLNANQGVQQLWYEEDNQQALLIATWLADGARFSYVGPTGESNRIWPSEKEQNGLIPLRIKLIIEDELPEARRTIWMASKIRMHPAFDYRDSI